MGLYIGAAIVTIWLRGIQYGYYLIRGYTQDYGDFSIN